MRVFLTASILALALAGSALADAAAGKALYMTKCKGCHGASGEGNPQIAKMLTVTLRPLASKAVQAKSDADLKKDSTAGTGKMKPVKLTDAEAGDVVAFLRTLK
ncbi:MAG: cytochrome c [Bryobacteraceae bacterium]|jgi:mono/diheme cytochrome c family protein